MCSGCEPLTPDDIAEVVVFAAGRRENVVLADSLIFPNHQVRIYHLFDYTRLIRAGRCYCHAQEVVTDKSCRLGLEEQCTRSLSRYNYDHIVQKLSTLDINEPILTKI